jgi:probable rRNA maturation factor
MRRMAITFASPDTHHRLAAPLRALVQLVLEREKRRAGEIGIRLTDDAELRELNRRWRKIDRATDVISFAYDEDEPDASSRPVNGDLVISLDRLREQAARYRESQGTELARLVIHGVLHLAGHDHVRLPERRAMRAIEEAALVAAKAIVRRLDAAMPAAKRRTAPSRGAKPARAGRAPKRDRV